MERRTLTRLLAGGDAASVAALAALRAGAAYVVWDGTYPAGLHARTYARRLRHTRRRGIETVGLERAVRLLDRHDQPVRLGRITAAGGAWSFMLFLTEDGDTLVACTGVRRQ
ncbi:hypothetical protein ACFWXA_24685 [Streptomyces atroolivaceus]|uniref:hypothetical protein n=1 Tax=Streptomyces atroolivaceus TaxID=66869 RepID=UPI00363869BC